MKPHSAEGYHTVDSIAGRDVRLSWFTKICGLSTYDGWDAGLVPKQSTPPPARPASERH